MPTRRQFLAHLMASGAYAHAAAAAPRYLFGGAEGAGLEDAAIVGDVQAFSANQTWRVLSVPGGATMDVSASADIYLQFGDALVDRVVSPSTAIYYPASSFGIEPIGIPVGATRVAVRAVQSDACVSVMSLGTPVAYGGPSVALRFDGATTYTLALPPDLEPPFTIICRFRSRIFDQTDHIVTNGLWGATAPQRAVRTAAGNGRLEVLESSTDGAQSALDSTAGSTARAGRRCGPSSAARGVRPARRARAVLRTTHRAKTSVSPTRAILPDRRPVRCPISSSAATRRGSSRSRVSSSGSGSCGTS